MTKDAKVSMKLEVCRDKTSGKLSITAHFNSNALNVIQDKDGYCWMPTVEEKDLLNEAFEFFPVGGGHISSMKSDSKIEEKKEEMPLPEPEPLQPVDEVKEPADLPPLETPNESDVFEVTDDHIKNDDSEKIIDEKIDEASSKKDEKKDDKKVEELIIEEPEPEEPMIDEPKPDEPEGEKKEYGEDMIVEADQEAIEAALKKHTKEAESIVEADEQTIIDKVLSQKKKGKWSKR